MYFKEKIKTIVILVFFLTVTITTQSKDKFIMVFGKEPSENAQYMFFLKLYTEAFSRLNFEFDYVVYPSLRATQMAISGEVDGEPQRIYSYGEKNPSLVRVDEASFINRTLAFAVDDRIEIDGLKSLEGIRLKVDYLRGSVWSKENLEKIVPLENLSEVNDNYQGFLKLLTNRTDIFIALESSALKELRSREELKKSNIIIVGKVGENYSYPYIHNKYRYLAPQLAEVLKELKEEGVYEKLLLESMPYMDLNQ